MNTTLAKAAPVHNVAEIRATMDAAIAPSTLRAYTTAQTAFTAFFSERGWDTYPTDSTQAGEYTGHVLSYLQAMAEQKLTVSTINKALAGIKFYAARESQLAFMIITSSREVKALMSGITRQQKAAPVRQAQALTVDDLKKVYKSLQRTTARNLRNRALIALGIGTALRAQSLADLNLGDLCAAVTVDGLNVRVRHSKTDQTGKGRTITVLRAGKKSLDPVAHVQAYLDHLATLGYSSATTPDLPLFMHVRGTSIQPERLTTASASITEIVRGVLVAAGVTNEQGATAYSSHSLRSTFITLSAQAGVTEARVAEVSGHKNLLVLRGYDRTSSEQHAQADYLS